MKVQRVLLWVGLAAIGAVSYGGCASPDDPATSTIETHLATVAHSCQKDEQVLRSMLTATANPPTSAVPHSCTFDEMCPCGSHCDLATNTCTFQCLADHYPDSTYACGAGTTCDTLGQCTPPAGAPVPEQVPTLSVDPPGLEFRAPDPGAAWTPADITVTMTTSIAALAADPTRQPPVRVVPSAGLEVACDGTTFGAQECMINGWSFPSSGSLRAATHVVRVRPASYSKDTSWTVQLTTPEGAQSYTVTARKVVAQAMPGRYAGTLHVEGVAEDAILPVQAIVTDHQLVVIDRTRFVSPQGKVWVDDSGDPKYVSYLAGSEDAALNNRYIVSYRLASRTFDPWTGHLVARIEVGHPTAPNRTQGWRLEIDRTGDNVTSPCPAGELYSLALHACFPGPAFDATGAPIADTFDHAGVTSWVNAMTPVLQGATADPKFARTSADIIEHLMCYDPQLPAVETLGMGTAIGASGTLSVSGDLACKGSASASNHPQWLAGMVAHRDRYPDPAVAASRQEMMAACVENMKRTPTSSALTDLVKNDACISLARMFPALEIAATGAFGRGGNAPHDRRGSTLLQRLLQEWANTTSFVAVEGLNEAQHAGLLDSIAHEDQPLEGSEPSLLSGALTLPQLLDTLDSDWSLFLDQTYVDRLQRLPDALVWNPDYRVAKRPLAYWTFDDVNRTTAVVDVANSNIYPLTNTYNGAPPRTLPSCITANHGQTQLRSGQDCFHYVSYFPQLRGNVTLAFYSDWSVSAHEFDNSNEYEVIVQSDSLEVRYYYHLGSDQLRVGHRRSDGQMTWVWLNLGTTPMFFRNVAIVRNAESRQYFLYLDGVLKDTEAYYFDPTPASGQFVVGASSINKIYNWRGNLDDVAVWDSMLSAEDIAQLVTNRAASMARPYWPTDYNIAVTDPVAAATVTREQTTGLPVSILEGLTGELHVVEELLTRTGTEHYSYCRTGSSSPEVDAAELRATRSLRLISAVEELARGLALKAPINSAWASRYTRASGELEAAKAAALRALGALRTCQNPMGIGDREIPLYYDHDIGVNFQFFAASKFLKDKADDAIKAATNSLAGARTASRQQYESKVQELLGVDAAKSRLADIRSGLGSQLVDLCGLDTMTGQQALDKFLDGTLSPETCFIKPIDRCAGMADKAVKDTDPTCFRGELGETILLFKAAQERVVRATSAWQDAVDSSSIWENHCYVEQQQQHYVEMMEHAYTDLQVETLKTRAAIGGIGSALSFLGNAATGQIGGMFGSMASFLDAPFSEEMDERRLRHEEFMTYAQLGSEMRACWNSAQLAAQPVDTAAEDITVAMADANAAAVRFQDMQAKARQTLLESRSVVQREGDRRRPSVAFHYWAAEARTFFQRDMERARRMTYLYSRMVEYDLQKSFQLDDAILMARHPEQLRDIWNTLSDYVGPSGVDGRSPHPLWVTVSLRDTILRLSDQAAVPAGELAWSPEQRFRDRLLARSNAFYDENGNYFGQAITFTLSPANTSVPARCLERLWRVNAQFLRDGGGQAIVPFKLKKREEFASRSCRDRVAELGPMQLASLRPNHNLFLDLDGVSSFEEPRQYTAAHIQSRLNENGDATGLANGSTYSEGASDELAGRGLYGEYTLVIPKVGALDQNFDLGTVQDIILRFDYVSVDDTP